MKKIYISTAFLSILVWNAFLIQRDQKLFQAYDSDCAELSSAHPDCKYVK